MSFESVTMPLVTTDSAKADELPVKAVMKSVAKNATKSDKIFPIAVFCLDMSSPKK